MFHFLSKLVLKKYTPSIVCIIGGIGRKSTSEATFTILASKFSVRKSSIDQKNKISLAVLGLNPPRSILENFNNFFQALSLIFFKKDYPEILILGMSAENSENISYLRNFLSFYLKAVVVSSEIVSLKSLKDFQLLIKSLPKDSQVILNYNNTAVRKIIKNGEVKVLTFGLSEKVNIRATDILFQTSKTSEFFCAIKWEKLNEVFINFKVVYEGKIIPIRLFETFGTGQVYASLGAIGVGITFGMNLVEISEALKKYKSPSGIMKLINGIKYTLIIDNTYNATLVSTLDALDTFSIIKGVGKIAVLGDMLELEASSEGEHRKLGAKVAKTTDMLFTVGPRAKFISEGAVKAGMDKAMIFDFFNLEKAGRALQNKIKQGDIILISGSKEMRLEKIVKEIMAEPRRAKELLTRQI